MKSILLFVLILASVTSAEQHKCGGFLHYIEWTIGAKLVKEKTGYHYSSKSEDLIACKIVDTNKHLKKEYIEIKEPFVSQLHPEHIKKTPFLSATIDGNGAIFGCRSINGPVAPQWDFSKEEVRSLDYSIYIDIVNQHPEVALFDPKEMKIDFLYFIPYHEDENNIYTLTWCPADDCSEEFRIEKNVVFFPAAHGAKKRAGVIISPLLNVTSDENTITMTANVGNARINFQLHVRTTDGNGKKWILAWTAQKRPE